MYCLRFIWFAISRPPTLSRFDDKIDQRKTLPSVDTAQWLSLAYNRGKRPTHLTPGATGCLDTLE